VIKKQNSWTILGLETSCDETAASIVRQDEEGKPVILSSLVASQHEDHAAYGGVVPEIAARAHLAKLDNLIRASMKEAQCDFADLDAIAATAGPGLIGGLLTGLTTARTLALALNKPFLAINHLEGHALTVRLTHQTPFPYLLLLVSGGHTQIIRVEGLGLYHRYGTTIDDALGEGFDKTAKLLSLGFPGGPAVEAKARSGDPERFDLPRPLLNRAGCEMSFSGLKTALRLQAEALQPLSEQDCADLCACFQKAVLDVLVNRLGHALERFTDDTECNGPLVVAGGVAANQYLRHGLQAFCNKHDIDLICPPPSLCSDNGAMIAWAGLERARMGLFDDPAAIRARSRWPLDEASAPLYGSGKKGAKV
jgi:N6-L-threonylcarbamoyladenine synthase